MKQLIISLIIVITIITGCRYKEGPLINFHSVKTRLQGTWQVDGFTSDGVDSLQYYNDSCGSIMIINFYYPDDSPRNPYEIRFDYGKKRFSGSFTFSDNKKIMIVSLYNGFLNYWRFGPINGVTPSKWEILKLTKGDFNISTDYNGRNYIISFKK